MVHSKSSAVVLNLAGRSKESSTLSTDGRGQRVCPVPVLCTG